jgi:hypothetical protein
VDIIAWGLMAIALVYLGAVFYGMRKGMNEIITGLSSIDQRLAHIEELAASGRAQSASPPPEA